MNYYVSLIYDEATQLYRVRKIKCARDEAGSFTLRFNNCVRRFRRIQDVYRYVRRLIGDLTFSDDPINLFTTIWTKSNSQTV